MRLQLEREDIEAIADAVVERLQGADGGWIDQSTSDLGSRRHIDAVRRRLAKGEGGAAKLGRRYLLSRAAYDEEVERLGQAKTGGCGGVSEAELRELGL